MKKERKTFLNISTENMESDTAADDKTMKVILTIHSKEIDLLKKDENYFFPFYFLTFNILTKNETFGK